jgi:hypothetical protein
MDMSKEQEPSVLLTEGWHEFKCIDMIPEVSKKGNDMFVCDFLHVKSEKHIKVWLVSVEGKRWMLKQLLESCGIFKGDDGKYNWDFPDVINKSILGYIQNIEESFIRRDGNEIKTQKSKLVEFKAMDKNPKTPEEIAWES